MAQGQEALNLGLLGQDACPLPGDPPPAVFSGLPVRAGQAGPPKSRDHALAHVWPWSRVQSWRAWVYVYFCSPECPE